MRSTAEKSKLGRRFERRRRLAGEASSLSLQSSFVYMEFAGADHGAF